MDKKARDVMSCDCTCIGENDSVLDAARRLPVIDGHRLVEAISAAP